MVGLNKTENKPKKITESKSEKITDTSSKESSTLKSGNVVLTNSAEPVLNGTQVVIFGGTNKTLTEDLKEHDSRMDFIGTTNVASSNNIPDIKIGEVTSCGGTIVTNGTNLGCVVGNEMEHKWGNEKDQQLDFIRNAIQKIKEEREKAEAKILQAIKEFEWSTGIIVKKLDFEVSRDKMNPKVSILLERI